jgi:hypothetical protein
MVLHQPVPQEDVQVTADGGGGQVEVLGELAHRGLALFLEEVKDLEARTGGRSCRRLHNFLMMKGYKTGNRSVKP